MPNIYSMDREGLETHLFRPILSIFIDWNSIYYPV